MKRLMALMALMILTACDYVERADSRRERSDGLYKAAMDDYRAGRLDAAMKGFEKAIGRNPANASARFQLACLQQEAKRDYANAYFGYREYLLQRPDSDKAQTARDRMALCEKEFAKALAAKHGLLDQGGVMDEIATLQRDLKAERVRLGVAEKEVETLRGRVSALSAERDRLLEVVKGVGATEASGGGVAPATGLREAKDLLEEDEESTDRVKMLADVAALKGEEKDERSDGSSILPVQTVEDVARREGAKTAVTAEPAAAPARPRTYVVKEGDTLYGIAKRFYGRLSAWKEIRNANKSLISADNRLRAGDTIRLP